MQTQHLKGIPGNKTFEREIVGKITADPEMEDGGRSSTLHWCCVHPAWLRLRLRHTGTQGF